MLALGIALAVSGCGEVSDPPDVAGTRDLERALALLPPEQREAGRALLDESDARRIVTALRALSRQTGADVVPFLLELREHAYPPGVRARVVRELGRWATPEAREGLRASASSDPDWRVSLGALEQLQDAQRGELFRLFDARVRRALEDPELSPEARAELRRTHDRWLVARHGALLPGFMRRPPPIFAAAPAGEPVRVLAFGDFGTGAPSQRAAAAAIAGFHEGEPLDFGITLGDNFYPDGMLAPEDPRWEELWTDLYGALGFVFYPSLGNHDWGDPGSPAAEILYRADSWAMPAAYYSFTAGEAQFFALDTVALSAEQLEWLRGGLEASTATWKIVYGHHPIRSHGEHGDTAPMVRDLLPVLRGRADLYLAGHDHDMQYLMPEDGLHLAVIGSGGAGIRTVEPGPRSLFCTSRYGFGVLDVSLERLRLRYVDTEQEVVYEAVIERDAAQRVRPARTPACLPFREDAPPS